MTCPPGAQPGRYLVRRPESSTPTSAAPPTCSSSDMAGTRATSRPCRPTSALGPAIRWKRSNWLRSDAAMVTMESPIKVIGKFRSTGSTSRQGVTHEQTNARAGDRGRGRGQPDHGYRECRPGPWSPDDGRLWMPAYVFNAPLSEWAGPGRRCRDTGSAAARRRPTLHARYCITW